MHKETLSLELQGEQKIVEIRTQTNRRKGKHLEVKKRKALIWHGSNPRLVNTSIEDLAYVHFGPVPRTYRAKNGKQPKHEQKERQKNVIARGKKTRLKRK